MTRWAGSHARVQVRARDGVTVLADDLPTVGLSWTEPAGGVGGITLTTAGVRAWSQALTDTPGVLDDAVAVVLVPVTDDPADPLAVAAVGLTGPLSETLLGPDTLAAGEGQGSLALPGAKALLGEVEVRHDGGPAPSGLRLHGGTERYFGWPSIGFDDSGFGVVEYVKFDQDTTARGLLAGGPYPTIVSEYETYIPNLGDNVYWVAATDPTATSPGDARHILRHTFTTAVSVEQARLVVAADTYVTLFLDGELIYDYPLEEGNSFGWKDAYTKDIRLEAGTHTIAAALENGYLETHNPTALLVMLLRLDSDTGEPVSLITKTEPGWLAYDATTAGDPEDTPAGWLLTALTEGAARGIPSATRLISAATFTAADDSTSTGWATAPHRAVRIQDTAGDLTAILEEQHLDLTVTIDPSAGWVMDAVPTRGTDRAATVELAPGGGVLSVDVVGERAVATRVSVLTEAGWIESRDTTAEGDGWEAREGGVASTTALTAGAGELVAGVGLAGARPSRSYTIRYVPITPGHPVPVADFAVGDSILAPDHRGIMIPMTVVALGGQTPGDGTPGPVVWTVEARPVAGEVAP